ncbi:tetratricopeptide repeat protein [Streptomyces sp. WAC04114]|uniref:tetratricopeptide repeat protein n=1 Tax=Streptomyces sp. WAC04114 TaxID=2867961 RepID=UPI001C8C5280|nr:tetratricopeptide repeat protein [Streptomyces sp. WAC04114]MBX9362959.1 tetratricopeptide repeat protein [Streptomyces sp. WAC04114]
MGSNFGIINTGDQPVFMMQPSSRLLSPDEVIVTNPVTRLPRPGTEVFLGRGDVLRHLQEARKQGSTRHVIFGLGGVGKSELALQHAESQQQELSLTWWITAETPDQISSGLLSLTSRLTSTPVSALSLEDAVDWSIEWLNQNHDWLLILDNVSEPAHVVSLLGKLHGRGQVVITTRRDVRWPRRIDTIRLPVLSSEKAIELIAQIADFNNDVDLTAISKIAEFLGFLPLALDQAAAYMLQTQISPSRYMEKLLKSPAQMLNSAAAGDKEQEATIKVWNITMAALAERSQDAVECLYILAFYAPDDIPRVIIEELNGDDDFDAYLGLLASFSMVTLTPEAVHIHRLVRNVLVMGMLSHPELGKSLRDTAFDWIFAQIVPNPADHVDKWPLLRRLTPHFISIANFYSPEDWTEEYGAACHAYGNFESIQGNYRRALHFRRVAMDVAVSLLGENNLTTVAAMSNAGASFRDVGEISKAIELQERALDMAESCGASNEELAVMTGQLGRTYGMAGDVQKSLLLIERSVSMAEETFGREHHETALRLADLGNLHLYLDEFSKAIPLLERALRIAERQLDPRHPLVAIRMRDVANAYYKSGGNIVKAVKLAKEALPIFEETLGPEHGITSESVKLLADIYHSAGRHDTALRLAQRALLTAKDLSPLELSMRHVQIAVLFTHVGRHSEAIKSIEKARVDGMDELSISALEELTKTIKGRVR